MDKIKTTVRIGGKEYSDNGSDSEEYIHRVAIYVDRKMSQIEESNNNLSTTMLAVLTCLNIADELLKLREETGDMRHRTGERAPPGRGADPPAGGERHGDEPSAKGEYPSARGASGRCAAAPPVSGSKHAAIL